MNSGVQLIMLAQTPGTRVNGNVVSCLWWLQAVIKRGLRWSKDSWLLFYYIHYMRTYIYIRQLLVQVLSTDCAIYIRPRGKFALKSFEPCSFLFWWSIEVSSSLFHIASSLFLMVLGKRAVWTTKLTLRIMEAPHSCFNPVGNHEQCISTAPEMGQEPGMKDCESNVSAVTLAGPISSDSPKINTSWYNECLVIPSFSAVGWMLTLHKESLGKLNENFDYWSTYEVINNFPWKIVVP